MFFPNQKGILAPVARSPPASDHSVFEACSMNRGSMYRGVWYYTHTCALHTSTCGMSPKLCSFCRFALSTSVGPNASSTRALFGAFPFLQAHHLEPFPQVRLGPAFFEQLTEPIFLDRFPGRIERSTVRAKTMPPQYACPQTAII